MNRIEVSAIYIIVVKAMMASTLTLQSVPNHIQPLVLISYQQIFDQLDNTYLSQWQAPRVPHGWLKTYALARHPH